MTSPDTVSVKSTHRTMLRWSSSCTTTAAVLTVPVCSPCAAIVAVSRTTWNAWADATGDNSHSTATNRATGIVPTAVM